MRAWLEELNLGRHAEKFEMRDIDPDTHLALTDRHLADMGINMEDRCTRTVLALVLRLKYASVGQVKNDGGNK